ncbi:hypothetical protein BC938DRAFT_482057 [Jimgerdemannia flammicorona]|uniref:Uncharacterized protein n=1 Tax=Jimgerdemannia flammicorona TaxID=994334 RepID=A0A433QES9_9FUNG|nr:hypothetical protein BC938DRAFT_482057 [Jimgerdemannia flammicorona]
MGHLAVGIVLPTVIFTFEDAVNNLAIRESRAAVGTLVGQNNGTAIFVPEYDDGVALLERVRCID